MKGLFGIGGTKIGGLDKYSLTLLLVYALEPMGLDKGYAVIRCITNHTHIYYMITVFLYVSTKNKRLFSTN